MGMLNVMLIYFFNIKDEMTGNKKEKVCERSFNGGKRNRNNPSTIKSLYFFKIVSLLSDFIF